MAETDIPPCISPEAVPREVVNFDASGVTCTRQNNGLWKCSTRTPVGGKPYIVDVSSISREFEDIVVGEGLGSSISEDRIFVDRVLGNDPSSFRPGLKVRVMELVCKDFDTERTLKKSILELEPKE